MRRSFSLVFSAFLAVWAPADAARASDAEPPAPLVWAEAPETIFDASEINLGDFLWSARPVVVFADSPLDPAFERQMALLLDRQKDLVERDVVLITDTDLQLRSAGQTAPAMALAERMLIRLAMLGRKR